MLQTLKNLLGGDSSGVGNSYYLLQVKAIEAKQLMRIDQNNWISPYLKMSIRSQKTPRKYNNKKTQVIKRTTSPKWMETFLFEVVDPISDLLLIEVWNKQFLLPDDPLGYIYIGLEKLEQGIEKDLWVDLVNTDSGQVHITIMPINFSTISLNDPNASSNIEKPLIRVLSSPDDIIIHPNYNPNNPTAAVDISQAPFRYKDSKIGGGGMNYGISPPQISTLSSSPPFLPPLSSSLPTSSSSSSPQSNPFQYNNNINIINNNTNMYSNNNNNNNYKYNLNYNNTTNNTINTNNNMSNMNYINPPLITQPQPQFPLQSQSHPQPYSTSPNNNNNFNIMNVHHPSHVVMTPQYLQYHPQPQTTPSSSSSFSPFPPPSSSSSISPPTHLVDTQTTNQNTTNTLDVRKTNVRYKTRSGILEDTAISEGYKIEFDHLKFLNRIGAGGFGEVWKGEWNGTPVAIKHLIVQSESFSEKELLDFSNEIILMSKLRHPNIVQFLGATFKPQICLVTEFMERGNLHSALENKSIELTWAVRIQIALDAARGIFYLHSRSPPLIHRDIKSPNILLSRDWKATISDFGLTKIMQHYSSAEKFEQHDNANHHSAEHLRSNRFGSPAWTAPEVLRNESFNEKIDVYSYGIVLWEIITREVPYQNINDPLQLIGLVAYQKPSLRPPVPEDCPIVELVQLMEQCWADDPSCRPNFKFIFEKLKTLLKRFN